MRKKNFKIGACKTDLRHLWEVAEPIFFFFFDKNAAFKSEFWPKWGFLNLIFGPFLGFGTENLGISNRKLVNFVIFGWNGGLVELKNAKIKGCLLERLRECERGVFTIAHPRNPFQGTLGVKTQTYFKKKSTAGILAQCLSWVWDISAIIRNAYTMSGVYLQCTHV